MHNEAKGNRNQYVDFSRPELIVICLSPQYGDLTLCCFGVPISLPALYNRPWSIVDDLP